ncbi:MAG: hypothetical protein WC528_05405 [Patescibacteria group bacterium]
MINVSPKAGTFLRQIRTSLPEGSAEKRLVEQLITGSIHMLSQAERQSLADLCGKTAINGLEVPLHLRREFQVISESIRAFRTQQEVKFRQRRNRQAEG